MAPSEQSVSREESDFFADQQRRREELAQRISMFCDHINLPGEDGDAAYDLLREAAARIGSDRLRFERLSTQPANSTDEGLAALLREARDSLKDMTDMVNAFGEDETAGLTPPEWQRLESAADALAALDQALSSRGQA